jgi:hypothetical protein
LSLLTLRCAGSFPPFRPRKRGGIGTACQRTAGDIQTVYLYRETYVPSPIPWMSTANETLAAASNYQTNLYPPGYSGWSPGPGYTGEALDCPHTPPKCAGPLFSLSYWPHGFSHPPMPRARLNRLTGKLRTAPATAALMRRARVALLRQPHVVRPHCARDHVAQPTLLCARSGTHLGRAIRIQPSRPLTRPRSSLLRPAAHQGIRPATGAVTLQVVRPR